MNRKETLKKAEECVCGKREQEYGSPEDNFQSIANLWSSYKNVSFTALDVSMMMALLKIARIQTGTATEDSFVDLAGYAACGAEISDNKKMEPKSTFNVENDILPRCNSLSRLLNMFPHSLWNNVVEELFTFGSVEEAREFLDKCKRYIDAEIVISMEDYITLRNLNDGNDNFTVNSLDAATTWDNLDDVKIVNHWNNFILIFPEPTYNL